MNNVNFEAIEKAWFKPKNKILFTKEELELLENVFSLAIEECPSEDIKKINELEQKIKIYSGTWFKPKKNVLNKLEYMVKKCTKYTSILNCDEEFIKVDDILYIIQELKKKEMK